MLGLGSISTSIRGWTRLTRQIQCIKYADFTFGPIQLESGLVKHGQLMGLRESIVRLLRMRVRRPLRAAFCILNQQVLQSLPRFGSFLFNWWKFWLILELFSRWLRRFDLDGPFLDHASMFIPGKVILQYMRDRVNLISILIYQAVLVLQCGMVK